MANGVALLDRRQQARRRRARRRRPASYAGCTASTKGKRGEAAPRQLSGRGLSYWTDGKEERILYVTPGYQLIALDATIGRPIPSFGTSGIVDLKQQLDQDVDPLSREIGLQSTPIVAGDVVIVGAAHRSGGVPTGKSNVKGFVRGFDVRTGKRLWIFQTIPGRGEFGNDTWLEDSWSYTGNTGAWTQISVDRRAWGWRTCPSSRRPATTTAGIGPAPTSSENPWSPWT